MRLYRRCCFSLVHPRVIAAIVFFHGVPLSFAEVYKFLEFWKPAICRDDNLQLIDVGQAYCNPLLAVVRFVDFQNAHESAR